MSQQHEIERMHMRPSGPKPRVYQWGIQRQWVADVKPVNADYVCRLFRSHEDAVKQAIAFAAGLKP